jgi:hypothetical protein
MERGQLPLAREEEWRFFDFKKWLRRPPNGLKESMVKHRRKGSSRLVRAEKALDQNNLAKHYGYL